MNSGGPYAGLFDTLICLVANNPTVLDLLSQKWQYTLFAPTDAAFAQIGVRRRRRGRCPGAPPRAPHPESSGAAGHFIPPG